MSIKYIMILNIVVGFAFPFPFNIIHPSPSSPLLLILIFLLFLLFLLLFMFFLLLLLFPDPSYVTHVTPPLALPRDISIHNTALSEG